MSACARHRDAIDIGVMIGNQRSHAACARKRTDHGERQRHLHHATQAGL